eukprot:m.20915 g.20915  ORF g.20915 m.20915 type:complete len:434 (+) comp7952_c0_seq1:1429-2730(+)
MASKDVVKSIAEQLGQHLSDECASLVSADLEFRLREVVQDAAKFMRHSKRQKMITDDINHAFRLRNTEPIFGFSTSHIPGMGPEDTAFRTVNVGGTEAYYVPERVVALSDILNAPLPKCPADIKLTPHWLAIEGVQPAIPQNPSVAVQAQAQAATSGSTASASSASVMVTATDAPVAVKQLVRHTLSKELQLYYENATKGILGDDDAYRTQVLAGLAEDPGLHQLVPYLAHFIQENVTTNMKTPRLLLRLVEATRALLRNPHIFLASYLHQIVAALLSCVVAKRLYDSAAGPDVIEEHWSVRDRAAEVIAGICKQFSIRYKDIQPRVTTTLVEALLNEKLPLTTHYGAIVGLTQLGPRTIDLFLIANLSTYHRLYLTLAAATPDAARRVFDALWNAVAIYLKNPAPTAEPDPERTTQRLAYFREIFGDRMDTL